MKLTNEHGISLPLAVWLLHDDYDYNPDPYYISATSLLKSTRQIILSKRVQSSDLEIDISVFLASRFGNAIHDSIQKAWEKSGRDGMRKLGYPEHIAQKIVINPDLEWLKLNPGYIVVWIEKRATKSIQINQATYTIGGKFDMVMDGRLFDTKTTSVWSYILGNKDEEYGAQGGIYKWLNPEIILEDHVYIQFIFTDWQKMMSKRDPKYPQTKALEYPVRMPSLQEIELFIRLKLSQIEKFKDSPDKDIPYCTDKELWRGEDTYKYYSDPQKTMRATKNFDNAAEANAYMASKGGKGVVLKVPGEVKACDYCPAFTVCKQKDNYYVAP
jgi:hypothetical protein